MGTNQLKGSLDLLLMSVMHGRPAHGYAIITALRERSAGRFELAEGTIYPALHKLESSGLITSSWDDASGRRRRIYSLTPQGIRALATARTEWAGFARGVQAVLAWS